MNTIKSFNIKKHWWIIGAAVTFIASLFYSNLIFSNKPLLKNYALIPTDKALVTLENVVMVILIGIIALAIILFLWRGLYLLINRHFRVVAIVTFCVIIAFFGIYMLVMYPSAFDLEPDAHTLYAYASRRLPYYWHHILTVAFYGGCIQVIPHPIAIPLFQAVFFAFTMTYGFMTSVKRYGIKGFVLVLLLLLPETFYLVIEPYRNCYSTILMLFLIWSVFDYLHDESPNAYKLIYIVPLMAVATVLRTEQMVFVPILLLVLLYKKKSFSRKIRIVSLVSFALIAILLSRAQGLGSRNYFGNDYLLVSTMNPARAILNDGNKLDYPDAAADREILNEICPDIAVEGVLGFRTKNESEGRMIHQSLATDAQRKSYIKAYIRLIWNNKNVFAQFQINTALKALGSYEIYPLTYQYGNSDGRYDSYMQEYETYGQEILDTPGTREWAQSPVSQKLYNVITNIWTLIRRYVDVTYIPTALHFAALIFFAVKLVISFVSCVRNKWADWANFLLSGTILGWFAIIVVMMPESRSSYFYSVLFSMYVLAFEMIMGRKKA